MINLLPPQARKHVLTEYWLRTISVWLLLVVVVGVLILTLLFPTYILIKLQLQARADTYQQVEVEHENFQSAQVEIRRTNTNAALLANAADTQSFSEILDALLRLQSEAIFVQNVAMQRADEAVQEITVTGQADTRDALAAFRNQLEASPLFTAADLPLENLARDRDLPFQITITIAEPSV